MSNLYWHPGKRSPQAFNMFWRVGVEILTAVSTKMVVFWVAAPCSLVEVYQRFRGPCCLHQQGDDSSRHYNPEDSHLHVLKRSKRHGLMFGETAWFSRVSYCHLVRMVFTLDATHSHMFLYNAIGGCVRKYGRLRRSPECRRQRAYGRTVRWRFAPVGLHDVTYYDSMNIIRYNKHDESFCMLIILCPILAIAKCWHPPCDRPMRKSFLHTRPTVLRIAYFCDLKFCLGVFIHFHKCDYSGTR
jgi:hypothetical protein